jgi:hypothetical protein
MQATHDARAFVRQMERAHPDVTLPSYKPPYLIQGLKNCYFWRGEIHQLPANVAIMPAQSQIQYLGRLFEADKYSHWYLTPFEKSEIRNQIHALHPFAPVYSKLSKVVKIVNSLFLIIYLVNVIKPVIIKLSKG